MTASALERVGAELGLGEGAAAVRTGGTVVPIGAGHRGGMQAALKQMRVAEKALGSAVGTLDGIEARRNTKVVGTDTPEYAAGEVGRQLGGAWSTVKSGIARLDAVVAGLGEHRPAGGSALVAVVEAIDHAPPAAAPVGHVGFVTVPRKGEHFAVALRGSGQEQVVKAALAAAAKAINLARPKYRAQSGTTYTQLAVALAGPTDTAAQQKMVDAARAELARRGIDDVTQI